MANRLAEVTISARHLADLSHQIGRALRAARDQRTEDYVHHRRVQPTAPVPAAVAVGGAGGRLLTRVPTAGQGPGVHGYGWKEDKVACLHVLQGPTFAADPHPQVPACFVDAVSVDELVRDFQAAHALPLAEEVVAATAPLAEAAAAPEGAVAPPAALQPLTEATTDMGMSAVIVPATAVAVPPPGTAADIGRSAVVPGAAAAPPQAAAAPAADLSLSVAPLVVAAAASAQAAEPAWPPERLSRSCVASMCDSAAFAKMVAQEAYQRNFFAAGRRAFLGDGQKYNWSIQQKCFKDFEPIADFIHPLCYLYQTAMGVAGAAAGGWPLYVAWLTACWQGRVAWVLEQLRGWQQQLGPAPGPGPPESDVREQLRRTLGYLTNNAARMDYPR
jgi:hypothetical protein